MKREHALKKDWLTAAELSVLKLRGLPKTKMGILNVIAREAWTERGPKLARRRKGKGGGFEYHINNLPAAARDHLAVERHKTYIPEGIEILVPDTEPDDFTQNQSVRRDARLELLAIFKVFHVTCGLAQRTAEFEFARAYNANASKVPGWIRAKIKTVSAASLQRWRSLQANGKLHDLGGKYHHVKKSVLARAHGGEVENYIGALIIKQPHLTADHIRDIVKDKFGKMLEVDGGELKSLPPIRTFQRFIANWKTKNRVAFIKMTNPDKYNSAVKFSGQNMNSDVVRLNQLWEIDASPSDVLTTDGRRNIYAVVDIWSRRMIVQVTDTPRTQAMLSLMRRAILAWGVPEVVRVDNGSDFVSHEAKRAFNSLAIERDETHAFSPWEKGTVERHIKTLQHGCMPLLPGFIGHNVADRKVIEERKAFSARLKADDTSTYSVELSHDELQSYIDRWVTAKYEKRIHGGLCDVAPFTKAASYTGKIKKIDNIRALDLLLSPITGKNGQRTVTKHGIRVNGAVFISGDIIPGEKVFIRHDPEDMGRIYCFDTTNGRFIAEAKCPVRLGIDPKEAIIAARREQARQNKEILKPLKRQINSIKSRDLVEAVLRANESDAANLVSFPSKSESHQTPELDAVASIETLRILPAKTNLSALESAAHERLVAEFNGKVIDLKTRSRKTVTADDGKQRFLRAVALQSTVDAGALVTPDELHWLANYQTTPEFHTHKTMMEDFPDAYAAG